MKNIKSMLENMTIDKYIALFIFIGLLILPLLSSRYSVQIFGKYITYTILALGLDILWGSTGLMNLGFAIFFGLGSYIFGISMEMIVCLRMKCRQNYFLAEIALPSPGLRWHGSAKKH